jgi:nicotinamide-nucleotide amidase
MTHISQVYTFAAQLGLKLKHAHRKLVTAESCTGGQLAQTITGIPGSAKWFERGFVTYSVLSKQELLGVKQATLQHYGPMSQETATEMAEGALKNSPADLSIAITGIAGPSGGTKENPVGTIHFCWALRNAFLETQTQHFTGDRVMVRYAAVEFALKTVLRLLEHS